MKAIVLEGNSVSVRSDYPEPSPRPGECRVRVLTAGICETDLQLMRGYMGFQGVLGHEFVGIAESGRWEGQRVVGEINCACRQCTYCETGLGNHCPHRSVIGILNHEGAFAEFVMVPEVNLHPVPSEVSTDVAVFTEPLAAAFQIPAQRSYRKGERVIVLGDGRLGNLCAQVARHAGTRVTVVGKHAEKLRLLQTLDIETALLDDMERERTADVVIDCTGSASGLPLALELVKPRGTIVLKTTVAGDHQLSLAPLVIDEITLLGSRCGPFGTALKALRRDDIDVTSLISARYPLGAGVEALEQAQTGSALKILLDVGQDVGK